MEWYIEKVENLFSKFESNIDGLSSGEANNRLKRYGLNSLPETKKDSILKIFFRQFQSAIIYILLLAAITVFLMGHVTDSLVIFVVLLFNAIIGTIQEGKAQNTLVALKKLVKTEANVLRDGKTITVSSEYIVPGDIVTLSEGDKVPADARIIDCDTLKLDEASLTGESEPVSKNKDFKTTEKLQSSDQKNMLFKGTYVIEGQVKALIVATGVNTVIGKISSKLGDLDTDVPLKKNIHFLSRVIIVIVLSISSLIFLIGLLKGLPIREMFSVAVAISVSAIPEGLPVVVTVVLATGVYRMSKKNVLVRKLQAVEALGQAKIIALDKTGTITMNQMMVSKIFAGNKIYEVNGSGYNPEGEILEDNNVIDYSQNEDILMIGKISSLVSNSILTYSEEIKQWIRISGDPTESAMLTLGKKLGFDKSVLEKDFKRNIEIPFNSKNKYHAIIYENNNKNSLYVAGAPEVILSKSDHSIVDRDLISDKIVEMSQKGLRVIALAFKNNIGTAFDADNLPELCFAGLVGISDTVRPEVKQALLDANVAGVKVVMITGDHEETAKAIANQLGFYRDGDEIITGQDLIAMPEDKLLEILPRVSVFARVTPEDKLKIVEIYRKRGDIVAMTGDGVNDALSLAAADLGVSMGKIGTEVAKEASDMVLLDDNFGSIVSAIEEGRNIYRSLKKIILYLFSTSMGEIFTVTTAMLLGYPIPILASQIIWLNFVTDGFLVTALVFDPKERGLLNKESLKRENKYMLDSLMVQRMIIVGLVMMFGSIYLFATYLPIHGFVKASTVILTVLAAFQWFNAWNCRSDRETIFNKSLFSNKFLLLALFIVVILQCFAVYNPFFQKVLYTTSLDISDWFVIVSVALSIVAIEEIRKLVYSLYKS